MGDAEATEVSASERADGLVRPLVLGKRLFARASSPASKRAGWTFTDQALSSVTNFALAVFVARAVDPREFGIFGLAFASYLLLLNLSRGLGAEPLLLRFSAADAEAQRAAIPGASGLALLVGVVSGVVVAVIALVGGESRPALLALAVSLPGLLLQDTWRFVFFAIAKPSAAALNDGVWAIFQFAAFGALYLHGVRTAAPFVLAWGLSGTVAAAVGVWQAHTWPSAVAGARWFMTHRDIGPMLSVEFFATGASGQLMLFSVALFAGLAGVASLRAAQVALGPLGVIYTAILIVAVPELTRVYAVDRHRMARLATLVGIGSAALALFIGFVAYFLPDSIGEQLLGDNWIPAHSVMIPSAIALALGGLTTGMFLQMRVAQAVKETLTLRIAMLVGAVALATLGAVFWDAKGAAWGLVIATAFFTWLSWRQARRVFARRELEAGAIRS